MFTAWVLKIFIERSKYQELNVQQKKFLIIRTEFYKSDDNTIESIRFILKINLLWKKRKVITFRRTNFSLKSLFFVDNRMLYCCLIDKRLIFCRKLFGIAQVATSILEFVTLGCTQNELKVYGTALKNFFREGAQRFFQFFWGVFCHIFPWTLSNFVILLILK